MPQLNVTIDGKQVLAEAGMTVLQAAQAAGVDIPTLCNHPALKPVGNCRICLVEIERQRNLQAACVFPITDGMVVHTDSPKVQEARKFVLELLLSDHAFYCMYCEMSGDCELQALAYRYGVDKIPYSYNYAWDPVDASREFFVFDPKRCIRCRRCVRVCHEVVANDTLGIKERGFDSKVIADLDVPFGESSCISDGACLQVCPTGALTDRRSAYMGRGAETQRTTSICSACGVGCGMQVITRSNNLLRIEGDWDGAANHGLLCVLGRFQQLEAPGDRYLTPLIRRRGQLRAATWEDALTFIADRLGQNGADVVGMVSSKVTNEDMARFKGILGKLGAKRFGALAGSFPDLPAGAQEGRFQDALGADVIVVAGADLTKDLQVVASFVKRALAKGGRLVLVDDGENGLDQYAYMMVKPQDAEKAVELASHADAPVVLYGMDVDPAALKALGQLKDKARFIKLIPGANTRGAYAQGFGEVSGPVKTAVVWASDETNPAPAKAVQALSGADFVVLQAAYPTNLSEVADVILPAAIWAEKEGTLTSSEGLTHKMVQIVPPCEGIITDAAALDKLASKLGTA